MDGTDFRIQDPIPRESRWFTKKGGPDVRYELAECFCTGDIVAFNGPFMTSPNSDISIFRISWKMLGKNEMVVGDKRYHDDTVNCRLKQRVVFKECYHHDLKKHSVVFKGVVVLLQSSFNTGNSPGQIQKYIYQACWTQSRGFEEFDKLILTMSWNKQQP